MSNPQAKICGKTYSKPSFARCLEKKRYNTLNTKDILDSYLEYLIGLEFQDKNSETYIGKPSITPILHNKLALSVSNIKTNMLKQVVQINKTKTLYYDDTTEYQNIKSSEIRYLSKLNNNNSLNIQKLIFLLTYYD